jgi:pimeloyl-ACP methyl ester carboxylesterase
MAGWQDFTETRVPVRGGELAVLRWAARGPGAAEAPRILLVHGITGNALAWAAVAQEVAGRAELIAVDLRGRAGSRDVVGPWGIDQDAADLVAVLDALELGQVVLAGHSLGAFIAAAAAAATPKRFSRLLVVDGGLGFPLPEGENPDEVLEVVVGPAVRKLSMTFADEEAYLDFHRAHPSFQGNWTPQLTAYLARDTHRLADGRVVSSCREEAIRADGKQALLEERLQTNINTLSCEVDFLYAARGMLNEPQALYDESRFTLGGLDRTRVRTELVPDTNHYSVVGPGAGAQAITRVLLR